jgi:hypothetical protein
LSAAVLFYHGNQSRRPWRPALDRITLVSAGRYRLKKYPGTKIYIYRENSASQNTQVTSQGQITEFFNRLKNTLAGSDSEPNGPSSHGEIFEPQFRADIPADITFIGFNLRIRDVLNKKHYLVFEECVDHVRFGLDTQNMGDANAQGNWDNLSWGHFGLIESYGTYLDATPISMPDSLPTDQNVDLQSRLTDLNEEFSSHAGEIAGITQQKPARIAISLNEMIPASIQNDE